MVLVEVVVEAGGGGMVASGPCRSRAERRRAEMSPRRLAPLLILGTILAGLTSTAAADRMSGLYVDNGFDQTIVHRVVSQREKREVEHEILNLLGLPDRPRNTAGRPPQVKRSAPKFLLDIYKNALGEDEDEKPIGEQQRRAGEFDLTGQDLRAIDQSDVIMTFAAHSKSLFRFFIPSLSLSSYTCTTYIYIYTHNVCMYIYIYIFGFTRQRVRGWFEPRLDRAVRMRDPQRTRGIVSSQDDPEMRWIVVQALSFRGKMRGKKKEKTRLIVVRFDS